MRGFRPAGLPLRSLGVTADLITRLPVPLVLRPIDPASVPALPGEHADEAFFELAALDRDAGELLAACPDLVRLRLRYAPEAVANPDPWSFAVARLDRPAARWLLIPTVATPAGTVTATVDGPGIFALCWRP